MDRRIASARSALTELGGALGKGRRRAAGTLAKAVTAELKELGFPHGQFTAALATSEPRPSGLDEVEFQFAPNAGEPARPLRLIASSGEISRVMLALKTVLASHDRIPVLVFDEIDANVGGEMGNAIGSKLATVARTRQVLCITHLPQVAVHGEAHLVVSKEVRDGRTRTRIAAVEKDARVEEVARMLGGRDLTSVTLKHAREMLRRG
jgi:DNA repair protein RecN (Recombination protein N)